VELRQWLHETCSQLQFMGELLPKAWLDVAQALPSLSDGVLTMLQATGQVRSALAAASVNAACSDEEMARILRFWSRVGEIFVCVCSFACDAAAALRLCAGTGRSFFVTRDRWLICCDRSCTTSRR
jgi:hypothetical protein